MSPSSRVLEVQLAGALGATFEGRTLVDGDLGGRRPRLMLAGILRQPDLALRRDDLVRLLWPDEVPPTWATALRVTASKARAALVGLLGPEVGDPLPATDSGYALRVPAGVLLRIDVDEAVAAVLAADGALAEGRASAAIDHLRGARRVLDRPFLGEEQGPWVDRQRAELRRHLVRGLEVLAEARLALHQPAAAAAAAIDALDLAPYRESVHRLLISAHAKAGNEAEALRAYERCRSLLADHLGAGPSPATEALHQALLGEAPVALDPVVPRAGRLRLVGREAPLAFLERRLALAAAGRGGVVVVTAPAGGGKTRVVRELADRARRRGVRTLWGTCSAADWAPPFDAVVELLPDLQALAPAELWSRLQDRLVEGRTEVPPHERLRVREDLRRALLAGAQVAPILVVVEDLQWADASTLSALRHLGPSVPGAALLLVATVRDGGDSEASDAVLAALGEDPEPERLELEPLTVEEVDELVAAVEGGSDGGLAHELHATTGGVPFFVEALLLDRLVAAPSEPPATVDDVVLRRFARLGSDAQALLRTASLLEGRFSLPTVAAAADFEPGAGLDAIEEALDQGTLVPQHAAGVFDLRHDLVRRAIAAEIPPNRRVRFHRWLAEAIEAAPVTAAESGVVAGQYHRSRSLAGAERGVAHAIRAAHHARACGSPDRAATYLGMALDLLPDGDPRRTELVARRGLSLLDAGHQQEGADLVAEAAVAMTEAGERDAAVQLVADATWATEVSGCGVVARSLAELGLRLWDDGPEDDAWARLHLVAHRYLEEGGSGLEQPVVTPERARAARVLHQSRRFRHDVAWAVWEDRADVLERGGDDPWALTMWAGRYRDAFAIWQRQALEAEARGQLALAANAWAGAASCCVAAGQLDDADAITRRARALTRRSDVHSSVAIHLMGARDELVHARGEGSAAFLTWVLELSAASRPGPSAGARTRRWAQATTDAALARIAAVEGDPAGALPILDQLATVLPSAHEHLVTVARTISDAVAAAWLAGDDRHLAVLSEAAQRTVIDRDFRCPLSDPRHLRARLAGLAGDVDGARAALAEAREVIAEDGLRSLAPIVDHDEGLLLLRAGARGEALARLEAAAAAAEEVGMPGWARRARALADGSAPASAPRVSRPTGGRAGSG